MPSTTRTDGPRHLARGTHRSTSSHGPRGAHLATSAPGEDVESSLLARVQRSRLAFATAVTVAALPILVLDNLPATADTGARVEVAAEVATTEAPTTTDAPTTTTTAPTTTTSVAPATTLAPTTTVAPTTTTTVARVRALAAPTTTTTAPPPAPASYAYGDPNDPATWDRLAQCESGGNWAANTGNGYYGGLQFSKATWTRLGGGAFAEYPHQATKVQQIEIGKRQHAESGWDAWPGCRDKLGYS